MARPKKTDEAPKRRGRPPKNPDKKAEKKAAAKKPRGRRGKKPADSSTFTFRLDNRLRSQLKKKSTSEYTSESSLCNRYIALGLQWGSLNRLGKMIEFLAARAGIPLDEAIAEIADDLEKEPVEDAADSTDADADETEDVEVEADGESEDGDAEVALDDSSDEEDVVAEADDSDDDVELSASSDDETADETDSADQPEKQAAAPVQVS